MRPIIVTIQWHRDDDDDDDMNLLLFLLITIFNLHQPRGDLYSNISAEIDKWMITIN